MDISPIYELRERLKVCTIAGTDLIMDDFRLRRAVEAMAPLTAASPVFAKIGKLAEAAQDASCTDRGTTVLEALSLIDAVLCTQGAVEVRGELQPLQAGAAGTAETNAPYSVLSVLLDALRNSGGGRYSYLIEAHEQNPEWFQDFRVKAALVDALGAGYSELAEQVTEWLKEETPAILPLLFKGFDPKGKKEMVRRVQVIEAVAGAGANAFYREQIPKAQKEVKVELIYALRFHPENTPFLLDLIKTEKGNARQAALFALACQEDDAAWEYLDQYAGKKPEEAFACLVPSVGERASRLVAKNIREMFADLAKENGLNMPAWTPGEEDLYGGIRNAFAERGERKLTFTADFTVKLVSCLQALPGKSGPEICACYEGMAAFEKALDIPPEGGERVFTFSQAAPWTYREPAKTFSQAIPAILHHSLILYAQEDLEALSKRLLEKAGEPYLPAALTAAFLTDKKEVCYEIAEPYLKKKTHLGIRFSKELQPYMQQALSFIRWKDSTHGYVMTQYQAHPLENRSHAVERSLREPLDFRFMEYAMQCGDRHMEGLLRAWICPDDKEQCRRLGEYFRTRALGTDDNRYYVEAMKRCGVTECSGLAVRYFKNRKNITEWEFTSYMTQLPGTAKDRAVEGRKVLELVKKGGLGKRSATVECLESHILEWESTPDPVGAAE